MKKKKQEKNSDSPSVFAQKQMPETVFDQVNNYGTYNIQPTADTENMYPTIAQGFHPKQVTSDCENKAKEES